MRISRPMAFWLRAALPVLALLLVATPPAFSCLYEQDVSTNRSVSQLRLTEIYLDTTPTLKIEWNYTGLGGLANPVFEVRRKLGASTTTLGQTTNIYWVDSFTWSWNSNYVYEVRVVTDYQASMSLPAPPMGADPADI